MNKLKKNKYALAIGVLMAGTDFADKVEQKTRIMPVQGFDGARLEAFTKDTKTFRSVEEFSAYSLVLDFLSLGVLGYASQEEKLSHYPEGHPCQQFASIWVRDSSIPIVEPSLRNVLFQRLSVVQSLQQRYKWKDKKGVSKFPNLAKALKTSMFGGNNNALDNFFGYVYEFKKLSKQDLAIAFNLGDVPAHRIDSLYEKLANFELPAFLAEENFRAVRNQLIAMIASWMTNNVKVVEGFLAQKQVETAESKALVAKVKKHNKANDSEQLPMPDRKFEKVSVYTPVEIPPLPVKEIMDRKNLEDFDWAHHDAVITLYNQQLLNVQSAVRDLVECGNALPPEAIDDIQSIYSTCEEMVTLFNIINGELIVHANQLKIDSEAAGEKIQDKALLKLYPWLKLRDVPVMVKRFSSEIEKRDEAKRCTLQRQEYDQTIAQIDELTANLNLDDVRFDAQTFNKFVHELLSLPDAYKGIVVKRLAQTGAVERLHLQWKAFGVVRYYKDGRDVDTGGGMKNEKKARLAKVFDHKSVSRFEPAWFKHPRSTRKWEPLPIAHFNIPVKAILEELLAKAKSESAGTEGKIRKIMATTASLLVKDRQERAALCRIASSLTKASSLYSYRTKVAFTYRAGHLNFYKNGSDFGLAIATKPHLADVVGDDVIIRDANGQLCNPRSVALFSLKSVNGAYTQIVRDIIDGRVGLQAKGFTLVVENIGSKFERALVQIPFVDMRRNAMKLNFKHLLGIDVNMHNLAYAIADPSQIDANGNPLVIASGVLDCQVASQMARTGRHYKAKKQMQNSLRGNDENRAPIDRNAIAKKKQSYAGYMIGLILRLMYQYQALPVFERGIGALQKGREMEALWNDVITAFVGGDQDADLKRRNQAFGVTLGQFPNYHFFPSLAGSASRLIDKETGEHFGWSNFAFKPGMTTAHEHTSQRCHHCQISVREQLQQAKKITQINAKEVELDFNDGTTVRVGFENELPKVFGRKLDAVKYELKKLAKWQQRVQPKNRASTDSRFAEFRCYNLACDHGYVVSGHVEHADINAAINIVRNGFQSLQEPKKDILVSRKEKKEAEEEVEAQELEAV